MPSTAPAATASLGRSSDFASLTVETAQSTGRPRASAIEVMLAIASFLTFSPSVPAMSSPCSPTGDGGADVRARRHAGEVRGQGDERAGARGPAAGRARPRR